MGPKKMPEGREKPKRAANEGQQRRDWMTPEQRAEYEQEMRRLRREGKLPVAPKGSDISGNLEIFSGITKPEYPPSLRLELLKGANPEILRNAMKALRTGKQPIEVPKPKKRK